VPTLLQKFQASAAGTSKEKFQEERLHAGYDLRKSYDTLFGQTLLQTENRQGKIPRTVVALGIGGCGDRT
jgi:hypothetical protein